MKIKILAVVALAFALCAGTLSADAQSKKDQKDALRKELNEKVAKESKKEAKRLKKEGWKVAPGALSLEKQVERSQMIEIKTDDQDQPMYFIGTATSVGQTYDAAAQQAKALARQEIASLIENDITTLIETSVANDQLSQTEAASITKSLGESKQLISKNLQNIVPMIDVYRTLKNGNIEVSVRLGYAKADARKVAINAVRKNLESDVDNFNEKLNIQ